MSAQNETKVLPGQSNRAGKEIAKRIFLDAMAKLDLRHAIRQTIRKDKDRFIVGNNAYVLNAPPFIVAFGKAANSMADALMEILGTNISGGVIVSPTAPKHKVEHFSYFAGGHPHPTSGSMAGAEAAMDLVRGRSANDLIIFLVSGGGSALMEKPLDDHVTLDDLIEFNQLLVTCGLPIEKINVLRKHTSAIKGGRLAASAFPARQLTIFISDVPEGRESMVASGPTMPDESTIKDCYAIAGRENLVDKFPAPIRRRFNEHTLAETPEPGDECFKTSQYFCLLSNRDAVKAAQASAEEAGFLCEIAEGNCDADFEQVASQNLAQLESLAFKRPDRQVAVINGGEVASPVTGPGAGGRNQAYVLAAARKIAGRTQVVLSAGTDGRDGNSPASGAVADGQTLSRAAALGLDPQAHLAESNSYQFFRALGDTIDLEPTDNNLRDIRLLLDFGNQESST